MKYMPTLQSIEEIPPKSRVILRMDMDVPEENGNVTDLNRLKKSIPTIQALLKKECTLLLLGHIGRPKGKEKEYSLRPVYDALVPLIRESSTSTISKVFLEDVTDENAIKQALFNHTMLCFENVRFWEGEEKNDPNFLVEVIKNADWYVNDALAVSHRRHRSMMLHHELPTAYGIAFIHEVQQLMSIVDAPTHPLTIILGGAKKDKLTYIPGLEAIADHILIGGKLPHLLPVDMHITDAFCIATLKDDGFDLNENDIQIFTTIIKQSKTIIWAGAMGFFENPTYRKGTEAIARAVVSSGAYTILAGGDTEASVSGLGEEEKINVIASGGGMMLELLTKKSLPAWE